MQHSSAAAPSFPNCLISFSPDKNFVKYNNLCNAMPGNLKCYPAKNIQDGANVYWSEMKADAFSEADRKNIFEITKILKGLKNPNITEIYDCWEMNDDNGEKITVFITEPISSGSLQDYLQRFKRININVIKSWCRQILEGLDFLHIQSPQIVHGNLNSKNIFITGTSGTVKIDVLGLLASAIKPPEFVAPEMQGEKNYDEKVDIYAFGMCLLQMVTAEIPYSECEQSAKNIFDKASQGIKPACFQQIPPQYPAISGIIEKCISFKKEDRPSAKELLENEFFLLVSDSTSGCPPNRRDRDAKIEATINAVIEGSKAAAAEATISPKVMNSAEVAATLKKRSDSATCLVIMAEKYEKKPDITFPPKTDPANMPLPGNPCSALKNPFANSPFATSPCPPVEDILAWNPFMPQPSTTAPMAHSLMTKPICSNCKTAAPTMTTFCGTFQEICCNCRYVRSSRQSIPIEQLVPQSSGFKQTICPRLPVQQSAPPSSMFQGPSPHVVAEFIPADSLAGVTCVRCKTPGITLWVRNIYKEIFCFSCSSLWMSKLSSDLKMDNPIGCLPTPKSLICSRCNTSENNISFKWLNNNEIVCNPCWGKNIPAAMLSTQSSAKSKNGQLPYNTAFYPPGSVPRLPGNSFEVVNKTSLYSSKKTNKKENSAKDNGAAVNRDCTNCKRIMLQVSSLPPNDELVCNRCKLAYSFIDGKVVIKNEKENGLQEYRYYTNCVECEAKMDENEGVETEKGLICKACNLTCKKSQSSEPTPTKNAKITEAFDDPLGVLSNQERQKFLLQLMENQKIVIANNQIGNADDTTSTCSSSSSTTTLITKAFNVPFGFIADQEQHQKNLLQLMENQKIVIANNQIEKAFDITSKCSSTSSSTTTLTDAFTTKKYSDVVFLTNDSKKVFAHRCILYSFSDIFTALFDQKPEIPSEIEVDFSQNVVIRALQFCYGNPAGITDNERELIKFAESFEIKGLKEACIKSLEDKSLTTDNVCDHVVTAFEYDIAPLKEKCLKYIGTFKKEIGAEKLSKLPADILVSTVLFM